MLAKIEHQPEKVNHYYCACNHCGKIMHEFHPKRLREEPSWVRQASNSFAGFFPPSFSINDFGCNLLDQKLDDLRDKSSSADLENLGKCYYCSVNCMNHEPHIFSPPGWQAAEWEYSNHPHSLSCKKCGLHMENPSYYVSPFGTIIGFLEGHNAYCDFCECTKFIDTHPWDLKLIYRSYNGENNRYLSSYEVIKEIAKVRRFEFESNYEYMELNAQRGVDSKYGLYDIPVFTQLRSLGKEERLEIEARANAAYDNFTDYYSDIIGIVFVCKLCKFEKELFDKEMLSGIFIRDIYKYPLEDALTSINLNGCDGCKDKSKAA